MTDVVVVIVVYCSRGRYTECQSDQNTGGHKVRESEMRQRERQSRTGNTRHEILAKHKEELI